MDRLVQARDRHELLPALIKYHMARIRLLAALKADMAKTVTDEDLVRAMHKYHTKLAKARQQARKALGWLGPAPFGPPRYVELLDAPLVPIDGELYTARGLHIMFCGQYGLMEVTDDHMAPIETRITTVGTVNKL